MFLRSAVRSVKSTIPDAECVPPTSLKVRCSCRCSAQAFLIACKPPYNDRAKWHYRCINRKCKNAGRTVHRTGSFRLPHPTDNPYYAD